MPVETFAAFATEQALGIVVGAVAVAAAPKLGPRLGSLGHQGLEGAKSTVQYVQEKGGQLPGAGVDSGGVVLAKTRNILSGTADRTTALVTAAPVLASTSLVKPVLDSSHRVYATVVGGAHWYGEQWSDLVQEAQAGLAHNEAAMLPEVLANLPTAKIVSEVPGRIRLRLGQIKGDANLAGRLAETVASAGGIEQVQANAGTGSLLINYDAGRYTSVDMLLQSISQTE